MKLNWNQVKFKKLFKQEDTRFMLVCGLKFSAVYLFGAVFIYYLFWIIISLNSVYLESKVLGFSSDLRETFILHSLRFLYTKIPEVLGVFGFIFLAGVYVGKVLLRPFEIIGKYSQARQEGSKLVEYHPDTFSDYKLMTRFSEFFFAYLEDRLKKKRLKINTIPPAYTKIHSPPFEKVFFFHFIVLVFILAAITGYFIGTISLEVRGEIINLFLNLIQKNDVTVGNFLEKQTYIFDSVVITSILIILVGYVGLCFHLYSKVAGAIFGFFATMRAFMKGNFGARVHLVGYTHIRPHSRALNKFLDHVERECSIDNNKTDKN